MTGQEMLVYLINKGLVHKIGEEYLPTSGIRDLLTNLNAVNILNTVVPITVDVNALYPEEIRNSSERNRVKALLDYCKVPIMSTTTSKYVLRSMDRASKTALLSMMADNKIKPTVLIRAITDYYTTVDYPKSVKKLVLEGDLMDIYIACENDESFFDEGPINTSTWV